ncbi:hypothetical protein F53441_12684 [Fusarium austroafricanum]|uniref:Hydrophobin n=1 Tax=Fusarium austroafricanum TaxID=2364996 RepID=A0A8H4JV71_9HYPO|nr:hypothetical protein F53441_12684 [Fusarium austroafricanum]
MDFMTTITVFVSTTAALTFKGWRKPKINLLKISEAQELCGADTTVRCCNKINDKAGNPNGNANSGLFGLALVNDLDLFNNCVDISLNVVGVLDGTLGRKCRGNVVCCRNNPFADIVGPINDSRPYIALSNLL